MARTSTGSSRRYETTVHDVREVSLTGTADAGPWSRMMHREGLRPLPVDGRAEITLLACASTYMGVRFREFSLCVTVAQPTSVSGLSGAYLARAYNSVRFFAFLERAWFKSPYEQADVAVDSGLPASFDVRQGDATLLRARMSARPGETEPGDDTWEGTVFLPRSERSRDPLGKLFFARLRGVSRLHPFATDDEFEIGETQDEVLRLLSHSDFRPLRWGIRNGAEHSRSRSYARATPSAAEAGA
jgi:hypothetical protein